MKFHILLFVLAALSITACKQDKAPDEDINYKASVPSAFGISNLGLIASSINKRQHTMATLYGNSVSVSRSRSNGPIAPGEKLVLVTWKQKPDEHWFGANIPADVESVEQITTASDPQTIHYSRYMRKQHGIVRDTTGQNGRIKSIFAMQASIMP
ncbi:hypothetical protein [Mucilaginibacter ginsenosidivorans]|uniref:Cytochrome P460 domain-containing protein n=1 Tax=Mucilaginibacter ginsenosidivorans TaxID=398053 RepID=A0A5B8UZP2_9SPHI|nr:hypothetical protein [Mucilaginibacter ginsenosidivorans]QEC63756.1 hypothetical protein FRZ54_14650 [Mucilaginibacter ginsenosidivorans]